jgi:hypothetical protein
LEAGCEDASDDDVHTRSRGGNQKLLERPFRHTLQAGDATDGQQRNVARGNPEPSGRQRMAKFVQYDASKDRQDEKHAMNDLHRACPAGHVLKHDPPNKDQKRPVHLDANPRKLAETPGPPHRTSLHMSADETYTSGAPGRTGRP